LTIFQGNPVTPSGDSPLSFPQPRKQRRPGPANPHYAIPSEQWPDVLSLIEHGESLRHVASKYNVSYETVRRVIAAIRKQQNEGGKEQ